MAVVLSPGCASESAEDARTLLPEELSHRSTRGRTRGCAVQSCQGWRTAEGYVGIHPYKNGK